MPDFTDSAGWIVCIIDDKDRPFEYSPVYPTGRTSERWRRMKEDNRYIFFASIVDATKFAREVENTVPRHDTKVLPVSVVWDRGESPIAV